MSRRSDSVCPSKACQTREKSVRIPSLPLTQSKSIRFPDPMIEEAEAAIRGKDCTFSAFVAAAVRAALESLKTEEDGNDQKKRHFAVSSIVQ